MNDTLPEEFKRVTIDDVSVDDENITLMYGGRIFGGVVRCLLDTNGVEDALRPGAEIFVRYHTAETGSPGQIAHIVMRHPVEAGWTEIYADGV